MRRNGTTIQKRSITVIGLVLLTLIVGSTLIGMRTVRADDRPGEGDELFPQSDRTAPTVRLVSVVEYASEENADSGKDPKVLQSTDSAGRKYWTRPGKHVRYTVTVSDYGKGIDPDAVDLLIDGKKTAMMVMSETIQVSGGKRTSANYHGDVTRSTGDTVSVQVQAQDMGDNLGKLWSASGSLEFRTTTSSGGGSSSTAETPGDGVVSFGGHVIDGKAKDGDQAVAKGCRGDNRKPWPGNTGRKEVRARKMSDGNWLHWYDGETSGENTDQMSKALNYYELNRNAEDLADRERAVKAKKEHDERKGRTYRETTKGNVQFTLKNTYLHLGDRPWA